MVRVSIVLDRPSTVEAGFATMDIASDRKAMAYRAELQAQQETMEKTISRKALNGRPPDVVWNMTLVGNIISAWVPYGALEKIAAIDGIRSVALEAQYEPCVAERIEGASPNTYASSSMIGSGLLWEGGYTAMAGLDTSTDLSGTAYEYIFLDGVGYEEEYAGVDVTGKIVLVSRGTLNFAVKANAALSRGAAAVVVYNNQSGISNMDLTGLSYAAPVVSITQADAAAIRAVSQDKGTYLTGRLTVHGKQGLGIYGSEYYTMSDFSSWGIPGSLTLKPEITAPGGNYYSLMNQGAGLARVDLASQADSFVLVEDQADGQLNAYDAHLLLASLTSEIRTVPAGGSAEVRVRMALTEKAKAELNAETPKGTYVEGFVYARGVADAEGNVGTVHSIPVLAFYGDWSEPSMYDRGTLMDLVYMNTNTAPYLYRVVGPYGNSLAIDFGDGAEYYYGGNVMHVDATTGDYYNWYYMFSNNLVALAYVGTQLYQEWGYDTMVDWYFIIDRVGYVYLMGFQEQDGSYYYLEHDYLAPGGVYTKLDFEMETPYFGSAYFDGEMLYYSAYKENRNDVTLMAIDVAGGSKACYELGHFADNVWPVAGLMEPDTLDGKCNMANYHWDCNTDMPGTLGRPWEDHVEIITKVVIEEGVYAVGQMAFYGLPNLREVVLADSVKEVRNYSFKNCVSLTEINLSGLDFIREGAVYGCSSLMVGDTGSEVIEDWAFTKTLGIGG